MIDLIERLRDLARGRNNPIGDALTEASYALEVARAENKGHRIAIQQLYDRAERLAKALQEIESRSWNGVRPIQIAARTALRNYDQEK